MIYLILVLFIFLLAVTFAWAGYKAAPWVPTRKCDVERFLRLADIKPTERMYDLGCGDGRLTGVASKAGAGAVGFEISLFPYFIAKIRGLFLKRNHGAGKYTIKFHDFWKADLSDADIVHFFLMPKIYPKLKKKFEKELKKGCKVIAYVWPIDGWTPSEVSKHDKKPDIYLYHHQCVCYNKV